ncbi:MAG: PEP-CTERM sorting domain-containing protein, partial [Planctomycetes bacterium]|nr:PEP-CTERM sorting domain-containing protein [Planctomycetota bacterium]
VIAAVLLLTSISISANGLQYYDTFNVQLGPDGSVLSGGGTGYGEGEWYLYPENQMNTQWFYNGPFDPERWKRVWGNVCIDPTDPDYLIEFGINWATPCWDPNQDPTGASAPPLPEDIVGVPQSVLIQYQQLFVFDSSNPAPGVPINFYFEILDFNPEWISVDVYGYNVAIAGEIWHECVPEPASLLLLAAGGMGMLLRRKK